jgi:hypothetical protein
MPQRSIRTTRSEFAIADKRSSGIDFKFAEDCGHRVQA